MSDVEYVFKGHDNPIERILKLDGEAIDLSQMTRMTITLDDLTVSSVNGDTDPIRWNKAGYEKGEVKFFLGSYDVPAGSYHAPLVVYSAIQPNGVVWGGNIVIHVIDEVEVAS